MTGLAVRAQLTLATSLRHTQVRSYLSLHLAIPTPRATARLRYPQAVSLVVVELLNRFRITAEVKDCGCRRFVKPVGEKKNTLGA